MMRNNFKNKDNEPVFPIISEQCCVIYESRLVLKESKKGSIFWGCSGYPKCKEIYNDIGGMPDLGGAIVDIKVVNKN